MSTADQVLAYLRVLVWPGIVLLALVVFRDPIGEILRNLEEFELFGVKARVRRQVTQAAQASQEALTKSPIRNMRIPPTRRTYVIGRSMRNAMRFSPNLTRRPAGAPLTGHLQRMRRAVEQLNAAIIVVLIATVLPEDDQAIKTDQAIGTRPNRDRWRDMSPDGIDLYLSDITGFTGWAGAVATRDILSCSLDLLCGRSEKALTSAEVEVFVLAGEQALDRLRMLVDEVASSAPG